jgi:hypothetical protein
MPDWTLTDGWILTAVFLAHSEAGAQLHDIIAAADATNHAIPTPDELSGAFTRLARCGLLTVGQDRFLIASQYLPAIKRAYEGKGGLFASADKGLKWLKMSGLVETTNQRIEVERADVESAYNRYIRALRKR